jgi:DNA-binding MarR family transcriptional regulator
MRQNRKTVAARLHRASIHLLRSVRTVDGESGLSPARLSALSVLVYGGPATIGELAKAEGVRSPTMTALITQLEADGLVRRNEPGTDGADRRRVVVEATRRGTDLMHTAQARRLDLLEELLGHAAPTLADLRKLDEAATILERIAATAAAASTTAAAAATAAGSAKPAATGTPAPAKPRASRPSAGTARKRAPAPRSS